ncbi:hypothetical protein [Borrelia crocidurae]|uniref:Uncharacterized protein n=1 Tax=Borrelia crocidurae (strain Achema) TaxID=1155096 RepID=I0FEA3_BORCA|nr:hypothetical protein [Borrelia crocidurae]AFI31809.1 hypothetical protein Q7M_1101 [Borrelia crocidurae str. Achema]
MYDRAKKDDKDAWYSYHNLLDHAINHKKACTYDQFNKFILNRKEDKIKAIFAKLAIDMQAEASAKKTILKIADKSQQSNIYTPLCLHAIYSRQAIAQAIASGNLDFDQIEANLMQLPSGLDKIKAFQKQAEDILKDQNKETK